MCWVNQQVPACLPWDVCHQEDLWSDNTIHPGYRACLLPGCGNAGPDRQVGRIWLMDRCSRSQCLRSLRPQAVSHWLLLLSPSMTCITVRVMPLCSTCPDPDQALKRGTQAPSFPAAAVSKLLRHAAGVAGRPGIMSAISSLISTQLLLLAAVKADRLQQWWHARDAWCCILHYCGAWHKEQSTITERRCHCWLLFWPWHQHLACLLCSV